MEKGKYILSQFGFKGVLRILEICVYLFNCAGFAFICYQCFRGIILDFTWKVVIATIPFLVGFLLFLYGAYMCIRQLRIITITDSYIEYQFLFFPFISWKHNLNEYDKIVHANVQGSRVHHSGVWLVKEGKIKMEIYERNYANYDELIAAIPLPHVRSHPSYIFHWKYLPYMYGKKKVKTRQIKPKKPRDGSRKKSVPASE